MAALQKQEIPSSPSGNLIKDHPQSSSSSAVPLLPSKGTQQFPKGSKGPHSWLDSCRCCHWGALLALIPPEKPEIDRAWTLTGGLSSVFLLRKMECQRKGTSFIQKKRRPEAAGSFVFLPRAVPAAGRPFLRSPGLAGCCPAELARPGEQRNPAGAFAWMQMQLSESRPSSE